MAEAITDEQTRELLDVFRAALPAGVDLVDALGQVLRLAIDEPPEPELTIVFREPLKLGSVDYPSMTLREPTAAQMLTWDRLVGAEADLKAITQVGGLPEPVVKTMGARDFRRAARYIGRFLG